MPANKKRLPKEPLADRLVRASSYAGYRDPAVKHILLDTYSVSIVYHAKMTSVNDIFSTRRAAQWRLGETSWRVVKSGLKQLRPFRRHLAEVRIHHRVPIAIGKHIGSIEHVIASQKCAVGINEPAPLRRIVAGFEEVVAGFGVPVVATVANRVELGQGGVQGHAGLGGGLFTAHLSSSYSVGSDSFEISHSHKGVLLTPKSKYTSPSEYSIDFSLMFRMG